MWALKTPCVWKNYVSNPATCSCKNGKYLGSIMNNSAIMCDEALEQYDEDTKTIPTNFNEKKATCKMQYFFTLLPFSLIAIELLPAASIFC